MTSLYDAFDALPPPYGKRLSWGGGTVLEINHLFAILPTLRGGQVVSRIAAACSKVLGCPVRVTYANSILKPSNGGADVLAHQDTAYDRDAAAIGRYTAWMPFRDSSIESGTVYYLAGSHSRDCLVHAERDGVRYLAKLPDGGYALKAALVPAGGFALHSSNVIHGSYPNTSSRPRLALSLRLTAHR